MSCKTDITVFQHTAARRRLEALANKNRSKHRFQHTAARRRLGRRSRLGNNLETVSTHSRPKAAGPTNRKPSQTTDSFNTQPPEGGWAARVSR